MNIRNYNMVIALGVFSIFSNCNTNRRPTMKIEGDLYFSFFRFGNFYQQPDSIVKRIKNYSDTVNRNSLDIKDLKEIEKLDVLKNEQLLFNPFIELKFDNDSIITIYLNNSEYEIFKTIKRQDLIATKKKIRIVAEIVDLGLGMAYLTKITSTNKIDGQTSLSDNKLRIEDYH